MGQFFSVLFAIVGGLLLLYRWSSHKWLDLSYALFGYLLTVSCNYVFIWVIQLLFRQSLASLQSIPATSLTLSSIYCFLCYVLTKQFGIWLHKHLKLELLLTDDRLMKTIYLTLLLVTILFIFNITMGNDIGYGYNVVAFNSILFLVLFLASASLIWFLYENIRQKLQAKYMLKQYEHLQTYTSELEKLYQPSRQFKHDYINILTTLSGYIDEGNLGELKRYFHQEQPPARQPTYQKRNGRFSTSPIPFFMVVHMLSQLFPAFPKLSFSEEWHFRCCCLCPSFPILLIGTDRFIQLLEPFFFFLIIDA